MVTAFYAVYETCISCYGWWLMGHDAFAQFCPATDKQDSINFHIFIWIFSSIAFKKLFLLILFYKLFSSYKWYVGWKWPTEKKCEEYSGKFYFLLK